MEQIVDSVLYQHMQFDGKRRSTDWLMKAYTAHCRLNGFRKKRKMCKDYVMGRQYEKTMQVNGREMTKREYMRMIGLPEIQLNTLAKQKRVILGQYRSNDVAPICTAPDPAEKGYADILSELLKQNMKMNRRSERDAKNFDEFLTGGLAAYKISFGHKRGKTDVWEDRVNPNMVFFPYTIADDLEDIEFVGMLHAMDFRKILVNWSHSKADSEKLRTIYSHCNSDEYIRSMLSTDQRTYDLSQTDFFRPTEYGKCRVIELWSLERREAYLVHDAQQPNDYYVPYTKEEDEKLKAEKQRRIELNIKKEWDGVTPMTDELGNVMYFQDPELYKEDNDLQWHYAVEEYWYYRYMAPDGTILEEGVSPYWDGGESIQPFVLKPYPFIDGEIHSHVAEMIPAQDYFNYYLIAMDFYIKNAAKGVMMVDEESLSEMQGFEEMCDQFIRTNGVVMYTSKKNGKAPFVQTAGTIPGGFEFMLNLSKQMGENVSGAEAAMQGRSQSQTSGVLFAQMLNQAATSLSDMMATYNDFLEQVALKQLKLIKCCYRGKKSVSICGRTIEAHMNTLCNIDCDVTIGQNANTLTYRALNNDFILNLGASGKIPMELAIEASDIPDKDRIMGLFEKYREIQQQQQNLPQPLPQEG